MTRAAWTLALVVSTAISAAPRLFADDLADLLSQVGERVADYYAGAQNLVVQETIRIQHEDGSMRPIGHTTVLVYDDHVEWTPATDGTPAQASVVRQLLKVDNRPARPPKKDDDWRCFQNATTSAEPLTMLLPGRRERFDFSLAGKGKADGRPAVLLEYREREKGKPIVAWDGRCVSIDLPGYEKGRIWVDEQTHDVLRVDEEIVGNFPIEIPDMKDEPQPRDRFMTLERAVTSTRYQVMKFTDPDEMLLVPRSIETADRWRGNDNIRLIQTFSNYRRFVGESHIVTGAGR
jgi:hypothetical protein